MVFVDCDLSVYYNNTLLYNELVIEPITFGKNKFKEIRISGAATFDGYESIYMSEKLLCVMKPEKPRRLEYCNLEYICSCEDTSPSKKFKDEIEERNRNKNSSKPQTSLKNKYSFMLIASIMLLIQSSF